ncbi:hypothetical protein [Actinomadura flavalba]|uniref:hypothetical protein n=1 Tax=Actinomadura flavalba TaxID=1120938 RepID=UPI000381763D|nr:hypothetical protein [Actinomadura flavalba]
MTSLDADGLAAAEDFLHRTARLLDRHRFALHFRGGPATAVLAALAPYANPDGGYGHALEPDLRGPESQPVPAQLALETMLEAGSGDPEPVAAHLASIARPDGGVPFVLPTVLTSPRAPWWQPEGDDPPGALNPTAALAGLLHATGARHPYTAAATDFAWRGLEAPGFDPGPYDALSVLAFLDHVPDRDRAEAAFTRHRDALAATAALDPEAEGHVHSPLDLAPHPGGYGRRLFEQADIDRHLDHVLATRADDGGWDVNFPSWAPATGPEWRGVITVARLLTLRAYGRLTAAA